MWQSRKGGEGARGPNESWSGRKLQSVPSHVANEKGRLAKGGLKYATERSLLEHFIKARS